MNRCLQIAIHNRPEALPLHTRNLPNGTGHSGTDDDWVSPQGQDNFMPKPDDPAHQAFTPQSDDPNL